jgi:hypothetical protein
MYKRELFGHQRFLAQIDVGGLPFAKVARVIELFAHQGRTGGPRRSAPTADESVAKVGTLL